MIDAAGAILLVCGTMASGDRTWAARLAAATARLAAGNLDHPELAAAAEHTRGLAEQNPLLLQRAVTACQADRDRAHALEDAGIAWARRGNRDAARAWLLEALAAYDRLGGADDMARVRSSLRAVGIRFRHWKSAEQPACGWDSLAETERRIADLVSTGSATGR